MKSYRSTLSLVLILFFSFTVKAEVSCRTLFDSSQNETSRFRVGSESVIGLVPKNIVKPLEMAAFLAWTRTHIPELYTNTRDFPVNFWEAVREQNNIQELFKQFPEYERYLNDKKTLLTIQIQTARATEPEYQVELFKSEASVLAHHFSTVDDILALIKIELNQKGSGSARGLVNDLFSLVDKNDKENLRKNLNIESILNYFENKGSVPANFRASAYGLVVPVEVKNIRNRFSELEKSEARIEKLLIAKFYKENEVVFSQNNEAAALKLFESVAKGELKNALAYFKTKVEASQSVEKQEKSVDLELREVSDSLAMWKSCIGIECTPSRFAYAPSERAFFIYSPKAPLEAKGYLSVAIVKDELGKEALYLKQFQGPLLSPNDVAAVLSQTQEIAKAMGLEKILIMGQTHTNYQVIRDVWNQFVDRTQKVNFTFSDEQLRQFVDPQPKDKGGLHHSEAMVNTSDAYLFKIPQIHQSKSLQFSFQNHQIKDMKLAELSALDRFEAGVAYGRFMGGKAQGEVANVFYQLGLNQNDVSGFVDLINNPTKFTAEEFKSKLISYARTSEGPLASELVLQRLQYVIEANKMRFKDSFSPENEAKNVTELVQKVRKLKNQNLGMFRDFIYVDQKPLSALKEKLLLMSASAKDPEDFKVISILFSMLKSEHLTSDFTFKMLQVLNDKIPLIVKGRDKSEAAVIRQQLLTTGFYEIVNKIYPEHKELVFEVIRNCEFSWRLDYYLNYNPEIRAQFDQFRNAALWNLKDLNSNRWWLREKVSLVELKSTILKSESKLIESFAVDVNEILAKKLKDFCMKSSVAACRGFNQQYSLLVSQNKGADSAEFKKMLIQTFETVSESELVLK